MEPEVGDTYQDESGGIYILRSILSLSPEMYRFETPGGREQWFTKQNILDARLVPMKKPTLADPYGKAKAWAKDFGYVWKDQ